MRLPEGDVYPDCLERPEQRLTASYPYSVKSKSLNRRRLRQQPELMMGRKTMMMLAAHLKISPFEPKTRAKAKKQELELEQTERAQRKVVPARELKVNLLLPETQEPREETMPDESSMPRSSRWQNKGV
jgi:hypothetical protein